MVSEKTFIVKQNGPPGLKQFLNSVYSRLFVFHNIFTALIRQLCYSNHSGRDNLSANKFFSYFSLLSEVNPKASLKNCGSFPQWANAAVLSTLLKHRGVFLPLYLFFITGHWLSQLPHLTLFLTFQSRRPPG